MFVNIKSRQPPNEKGLFVSDVLQVRCKPSSYTALFRGRVDTDKDEIGLLNCLVNIGGKEEITSARFTNNVFKARFIDGQSKVWAVPSIYASFVEVDDGNCNLGAFQGDYGTRRTTYEIRLVYVLTRQRPRRHGQYVTKRVLTDVASTD